MAVMDCLPATSPFAAMILLLALPLLCLANNNTTTVDDANYTATSTAVLVNSTNAVHLTALYGTTLPPNSSVIPDVVTTIGVIACCGLLGLGIAKLGDYLYDRRMATRDDISNASEYTKNILRARWVARPVNRWLAVMKMKSDPPTEDARTVKKAASAWIENTVKRVNSATNRTVNTIVEQNDADAEKGEKEDADVEKANIGSNEKNGNEEGPANEAFVPPTITVIPSNTPSASPMPHNKVSPATAIPMMPSSNREIKVPASTRLPPISPRPEAPDTKAINQPIRSTR